MPTVLTSPTDASCSGVSTPPLWHIDAVRGRPPQRYYIGAPLRRLNGAHVGVLCVVDTRRRHPASPDQAAYLMGLARQASTALEARLDRQVRSRLA
ncbi:GAF domain-containing protein [Sphingomonas paucimobilis]|uniref:GAF domain-containing protein n=1 Tax=Sphingomonas paucimobilis TaxID=13689 RepID=UPI0039F0FE21